MWNMYIKLLSFQICLKRTAMLFTCVTYMSCNHTASQPGAQATYSEHGPIEYERPNNSAIWHRQVWRDPLRVNNSGKWKMLFRCYTGLQTFLREWKLKSTVCRPKYIHLPKIQQLIICRENFLSLRCMKQHWHGRGGVWKKNTANCLRHYIMKKGCKFQAGCKRFPPSPPISVVQTLPFASQRRTNNINLDGGKNPLPYLSLECHIQLWSPYPFWI